MQILTLKVVKSGSSCGFKNRLITPRYIKGRTGVQQRKKKFSLTMKVISGHYR